MERVNVAIVGGGPAGTAAAHAAASDGAATVVFEKGVPRADREGLGPDSTDAAGILDYWVDIMDIHPDEFADDILLQHLDRAEFIGPNESCTIKSTGIESSYDQFGYTFNRARFDDWLRERAEDAGAEYRTGVRVTGVDSDGPEAVDSDLDVDSSDDDPRHVVSLANGDTVGADFLILTDGPQRTVTNKVLDGYLPDGKQASELLASPKVNHIAYQEYRRFPEEVFEELKTSIKFWWGVMPGHTAYPWVFPNDNQVCRVGLTMPIGLDIDAIAEREEYALLKPDDDRIPQGDLHPSTARTRVGRRVRHRDRFPAGRGPRQTRRHRNVQHFVDQPNRIPSRSRHRGRWRRDGDDLGVPRGRRPRRRANRSHRGGVGRSW